MQSFQGDTQRQIKHGLALGAAEMGDQDGQATFGQDVVHGRHDSLDPRGIAHHATPNRHIDINPGEHPFAGQVHVVECFPAHVRLHFRRA